MSRHRHGSTDRVEKPGAAEKEAAFAEAHRCLKNRIDAFINLPMKSIDELGLGPSLREIGRMEGGTAARDCAR